MFQKIIGIIGVLAVAGAITMVAISPKTEGFFPGLFDFIGKPSSLETLMPEPEATPLIDSPIQEEVVILESASDSMAVE